MLTERFSLTEKRASSITRVISIVGLSVLFGMMLLISADILSRFIFNYPIKGGNELVSLLLGIVVFLCLAHCEYEKGHVAVEVLTDRLPKKAQAIVGVLMYLIYLAVACLLTWILARRGMYILRTTHETTMTLHLPLYPFYFVGAFGFALVVVMTLLQLLKYVGEVIEK